MNHVQNTGTQRLLLACSIIGPLLFNGVYLVVGATRANYDPWRQPISDLSQGNQGWLQDANFIIFGLFSACFAIALRRALNPGIADTWAPLLQGMVGLGLVIVGIFTQDPVHTIGTIATFDALTLRCLVMARRFAVEPQWRGWASYSVVTALLGVVFLSVFGVAMVNSGPAGLFERLATIVNSIWVVLLAARLLAGTGLSNQPEATA